MAQEAAQETAETQEVEGTQETAETKTFDADYVKGLRAEAAKHRKEAAEARKRAEELETAQLSETEKLKKEAEDGRRLAESATTKLRSANLRDALAEQGFTGARAKAVARLLSGVEYDDEDEPKNLKERLKAAESEFGDIAKAGASGGGFDGGARGGSDAPMDMNALIRRAA